jgi:hypothetical protein
MRTVRNGYWLEKRGADKVDAAVAAVSRTRRAPTPIAIWRQPSGRDRDVVSDGRLDIRDIHV